MLCCVVLCCVVLCCVVLCCVVFRDCIGRILFVKLYSEFFAEKLAKHSEGMRLVKIFFENMTTFFVPEYIFSPTDNSVGSALPTNTITSNFK